MSLYSKLVQLERFDLIKEYSNANNKKDIHDVQDYYGVKFKWKCSKSDCDYEWEAQANARYRSTKPSGCPACAARQGKLNRTITGINDLETWCKENNRMDIVEMINLAGIDDASKVGPQSEKKIHFKCIKCGHNFIKDPSHMTRKVKPAGCPSCNSKKQSSTEEVIAIKILEHYCPDIKYRFNKGTANELDAYVEDLGFAMEWDGYYFHGVHFEQSSKSINNKDIYLLRIISLPNKENHLKIEYYDNETVIGLYMSKRESLQLLNNIMVETLKEHFGYCIREDDILTDSDLLDIQNDVVADRVDVKDCGLSLLDYMPNIEEYKFSELNGIDPSKISGKTRRFFKLQCPRCKEIFEKEGAKIKSRDASNLHSNCRHNTIGYLYPELAKLILEPDPFTIKKSSSTIVSIQCKKCNNILKNKMQNIYSNNIIKGFNMQCKECNNIIFSVLESDHNIDEDEDISDLF